MVYLTMTSRSQFRIRAREFYRRRFAAYDRLTTRMSEPRASAPDSQAGGAMIDQETRRRDCFCSGIPVRLANGQFWTLPLPSQVSGSDTKSGDPSNSDYERLLQAIMESQRPEEQAIAELALAIELLNMNYMLCSNDLQALLSLPREEGANLSLRNDLHNVAVNHLRERKPRPDVDSGQHKRGAWTGSLFQRGKKARRVSSPAA